MSTTMRALLTMLLAVLLHRGQCQTGVRAILVDEGGYVNAKLDGILMGIGVDRDMNDRLSLGIQMLASTGIRYNQQSFRYYAAYHLASNEGTSVHFGSMLTWSRMEHRGYHSAFTLGPRLGIRGSLVGWYADFSISAGPVLGARGAADEMGVPLFMKTYYQFGLAIGWGK